MIKDPLVELEDATYFARFDDGLLDLFIGFFLLWIGASWLWFENLAAFAGLLPALSVTPFAIWRSQFLRDRGGYVRFSQARRDWERRHLGVFLGVGTAASGLVILLLSVGHWTGRDLAQWLAPSVIALIVAAMVGLLAAVSRLPRLGWYALLLVLGGLGAAALDTNPGAPLLPVGLVITARGAALLSRYLRTHPTPRAS